MIDEKEFLAFYESLMEREVLHVIFDQVRIFSKILVGTRKPKFAMGIICPLPASSLFEIGLMNLPKMTSSGFLIR